MPPPIQPRMVIQIATGTCPTMRAMKCWPLASSAMSGRDSSPSADLAGEIALDRNLWAHGDLQRDAARVPPDVDTPADRGEGNDPSCPAFNLAIADIEVAA